MGAVLLDFSAAFDTIDHNLLLKNIRVMAFKTLPYHGFRAIYIIELKGLSLMEDSLMSNHVKCGVPQGSSLGPLLFSILNKLPTQEKDLHCNKCLEHGSG